MMGAMTLTEFLEARIAEDEAATTGLVDTYEGFVGRLSSDAVTRFVLAPFMARFDPARILAEVEVKRLIVEEHRAANYDVQGFVTCARCVDPDGWTVTQLPVENQGDCLTVKALALPYADHPDYLSEWRP